MSETVNTSCGCDMVKIQDMMDTSNKRIQKMLSEEQKMQRIDKTILSEMSRISKEESIDHHVQKIIASPHYTEGRIYEPRKVIHDWGLNFNLGNVVKYVSRAGRKEGEDALIDLQKARQYLEFEIEEIENARNS